MTRLDRPRPGRLRAWLLIGCFAFGVPARAQDDPADVFDDPPEAAEPAKADAPKPADSQAPDVSDRDKIGFTQENVAAQMAELEERMFRLSEALRALEPENASRLSLALKFSREEMILQQMRETRTLLSEAQLNRAETEARELLAKLEHLRSLLLAEDLDFQLKLARLRQMRESLAQLDRIIKEERRELAWTRTAAEDSDSIEALKDRRDDLQALVRDQEGVVEETKGVEAAAEDRSALATREAAIRRSAAGLASIPPFAGLEPAYLKQADPHLGDAESLLGTSDGEGAIASEERALDLFHKELDRLDAAIAAAEKSADPAEFAKFEADQARNRTASDTLAAASSRLGDAGIALQKDLIRASGSMRDAESDLSAIAAEPAAVDQDAALKHLVKGRDELAQAVEGLLVKLRTELQARIIAELTEMHEIQAAIRESTEAQAPRASEKSRTALLLLAGLSKKEAEIAERTETLVALVEETEFGIALPTALKVLSREMRSVEGWLQDGDASPDTVALEKRIEEDLLGLLQAMRRLPPTTPPPPGSPLPTQPRERERELNRLIAELKMIRLLQSRLNDDTLEVDGTRPDGPVVELDPALRLEIEDLQDDQDEIRGSLSKIADHLRPAPSPSALPTIPGGN